MHAMDRKVIELLKLANMVGVQYAVPLRFNPHQLLRRGLC